MCLLGRVRRIRTGDNPLSRVPSRAGCKQASSHLFANRLDIVLYALHISKVCELRRTPSRRSSVAGISSVLCMSGYQASILYIRDLAAMGRGCAELPRMEV